MAGPLPSKRMREALVIVIAAIQDMSNHQCATLPTPAQQIAFRKRFQQRFSLIQPRSIDRGEEHMHARRQVLKEFGRCPTDMTRPIVDHEVKTCGPTVGMQQTTNGWLEMFTIISLQTLGPHMTRVDRQADQ